MILLLFLLLLFAGSADAVTKYVRSGAGAGCSNGSTNYRPATNDCGTGGTATVYTSIKLGVLGVAAGDILLIRAGTYDGAVDTRPSFSEAGMASGTSSAPITIGAYPGNCATAGMRGPGSGCEVVVMTGYSSEATMMTSGKQWLVFENFKIDAHDAYRATAPDSNTTFRNMELCCANQNVVFSSQGGFGMFAGYDKNNIQIINSKIHSNGLNSSSPFGFYGMGFYWQAYDGLLENNEIYNNGSYGIQVYCNLGAGECGTTGTSGNILRGNYFHHNGVSQGGAAGATIAHEVSRNVANQVYNNVFANTAGGDGLQLGPNNSTTNDLIYNNTFYQNSQWGIQTSNGNPVIRNNLFQANSAATVQVNSGTPSYANNMCATSDTGCNLVRTVGQIALDTTTFQLGGGSQAIDAGTAAIASGVTVPACPTNTPYCYNSTSPDIGAYESGTVVTPPPTCPSVPNALVASYGFEGNGNDSSGVNTATLGSGWSYTTGKYGQGATSTGVSGITVADANALDMCGGFTYEAWVSIPNTSGDYALINKNPNSSSFLFASFSGYCGSGVPIGGYDTGSSSAVACYSTPVTTGSFQHLAVTYDASLPSANLKLYLNGTSVSTGNGTDLLSPTTGTLQFCTSSFGETCPSGTIIDEVRIYNYARTGAQIITDRDTPVIAPGTTNNIRLGLHVTQNELDTWKNRATSGPYKTAGDVVTNSPGDWTHIKANADALVASPTTDRFDGTGFATTGSCFTLGGSVGPETNRQLGEKTRDAGFAYLVLGTSSYLTVAKNNLLYEAGIANLNFASSPPWCTNTVWDTNPFFDVAHWLVKLVYAYDYIRPALVSGPNADSSAVTTLDTWFLNMGVYWEAIVNQQTSSNFANSRQDNLATFTLSGTGTTNSTTLGTRTYCNGPFDNNLSGKYQNRMTSFAKLFAQIGVMLNQASVSLSTTTHLVTMGKRFFMEWMQFAIMPDGTPLELERGIEDGIPQNAQHGWRYSTDTAASMGQIADAIARTGDTALYTYSTSNGAGSGGNSTAGGPKGLSLVHSQLAQYVNQTETGAPRYSKDSTTTCSSGGSDTLIGPQLNAGTGEASNRDTFLTMSNLYYQSISGANNVRSEYLRTSSGAPAYPASPETGGYYAWGGPSGEFPGVLFMFGQMESTDVYPPFSSSPLATPTLKLSSGTMKFGASVNALKLAQ